MERLDLECAKAAAEITKGLRNTTKADLTGFAQSASTVLMANGPYALFLYMAAYKKSLAEETENRMFDLLKRLLFNNESIPAPGEPPAGRVREDPNRRREWEKAERARIRQDMIRNHVATDLTKLLIARDVLQQVLVYLKYHAALLPKEAA